MKNNLKTKVMLAVLAGGMLCANGAWAGWYGTASGFVNSAPNPAVLTGINLTIDAQTMVNGDTVADAGSVYGGYTGNNENVSNNTITFDIGDVTINAGIYGGHSGSGSATHNSVIVDSGTFNCDCGINGGYSSSGNAASNTITINNGTFNCKIYGGFSGGGVAGGDTPESGNKVIINNGMFYNNIYGGWSEGNNVKNNSVTIKGGQFNGSTEIYGGKSGSGDATGNSVTIKGGKFSSSVSIYGGYTSGYNAGNADNNVINIAGGVFDKVLLYGGFSYYHSASGNVVNITGGIFGDGSMIRGAMSTNGSDSLTNNHINISGGYFADNLYISAADGYNSNIQGNVLTISGGTFGNGVNLTVYGKTYNNNTLNLNTIIGGTVASISNFQNVNFTLPKGMDTELPMVRMMIDKLWNWDTSSVALSTDLNETSLSANDYITLVKGVSQPEGRIGQTDYYVLKFGDSENSKELVYAPNGAPIPKGDYTIIQGNVKGDSETTGTYSSVIQGNTAGSGLTVTGGTLSATRYTGNEIIIRRGIYSKDTEVFGAFSAGSENVTNNKVSIYDGTFNGFIYGGYTVSGNATGNSVTISGGIFNGDIESGNLICGGCSQESGATENFVTINGGTFSEYVCGGYSNNGNATGNFVTINGGTFSNIIFGGFGLSSAARGNSVIIKNGIFNGSIFGGRSVQNGDAMNNTVTIEGGTFSGEIHGGYSANGTAGGDTPELGNKVIINGGTFSNSIYGGYSNIGNAKNNSVTINDGTFNGSINGGYSTSGNVTNNSLTINGGTFNNGSYISSGWARDVSKNAANNVVTINGGTFNNIGGFSGGQVGEGNLIGAETNNTLNLKIKMGGKQGCADHFQNFNFTLPVGTTNRDVMMSVMTLAVDYQGNTATVNVYAANGVKLKKDDVITLIQSDSTVDNYVAGSILGGAADFYFEGAEGGEDKNGDNDTKDLVIVLNKDFTAGGGADQQKAPVEGVAAAAAMVNVSADLASGEGMDSMLAETAGGETNTFGAVSAGRSKFKTGSHVDVDGWGVVVGAGKTKEWTNGSATTMGIFLEYGKGDFDTYNGVFHGDGDTKNHGVGVMARHKATNNNYYEGNIRYGRQETSWGQSEIGGYETDSRYYGVMVGMGHIIQLGKNELDVYGRYSYGHVGACNAKVGDNDYRFDSVKSHRVRVGGKYNFVRANSKAKPFVGVAWEHEFNGESKATIAGVGQAPAPSLKGNTGIIQAGCDWELGEKWSVGASANAYVGKRKGWDGMLRAFYTF